MQAWESRLQTAARWLTVALPILLVSGRAAADSALSLAAILFLVRSIATGDWSWTRRTWVRVAFGLWIWMLIISNFAYKVGPSYTEALAWMRFVVFAAAAEGWILDRTWIRRLIYVSGAVLLFTTGDAVLQYMSGHDLFGYPSYSPTRLTGPFYPHPEVGMYMTRLFFPAIVGAFGLAAVSGRAKMWRLVTTAIAVVIFAAIFLSGERAALILTLFGLVLIVLTWQGWRRALIAIAAIAALAVFMVDLNPPIIQRQLESTAQVLSTFKQSDYYHLWETGMMMGRAHPITGVGMHNFRYVCQEPAKHFPSCNLHPHNMYIQWFAESGLPGLIGFVLLVGVWLKRLWDAALQPGATPWVLGPAIGALIQIWPFITTGSFFSNWNAVTFWLVLGWGLASVGLYNKTALHSSGTDSDPNTEPNAEARTHKDF